MRDPSLVSPNPALLRASFQLSTGLGDDPWTTRGVHDAPLLFTSLLPCYNTSSDYDLLWLMKSALGAFLSDISPNLLPRYEV